MLLLGVQLTEAQEALVGVSVRFDVNKGKHSESKIVITKDGALFKTIDPGKSKFSEELAFGHHYMMTFEKPGYITKRIAISTKGVPKDVQEDELDFDFAVEIFKQYEGINTVVFNQPVARYFYDTKEDGFAYDTDYTKSIRAALSSFEEEYKQQEKLQEAAPVVSQAAIAQEEQRKAVEARAAEEQKKAAEAKAAEEKRIAAQQEEARKAEEAQKAESDRKAQEAKAAEEARLAAMKSEEDKRKALEARQAEEARLAKLREEEEARKAAAMKAAEEERNALTAREAEEARQARLRAEEEARKAAAQRAEEEERNAQKARSEEEKRASEAAKADAEQRQRSALAKAEEESRLKAETAKAEEEKRRAAAARAEEETRAGDLTRFAEAEQRKKEEQAKVEEERRKREARERAEREQRASANATKVQTGQKPMSVADAGKMLSRSEEVFREGTKEITEVTIVRERQTFVYRMVRHDWGGLYFFKNDNSITKRDFEIESNPKH